MKKLTRLGLLGGTAAAALALGGSALAAYVPSVDASVPNGLGATGPVRLHLAVGPTDDTTARLVVYFPAGFTVNPPAPTATFGTVDAKVRAGDLGGAIVPVTGDLESRPATGNAIVSGVPVPLASLAVSCTGTATHLGFWVFKLSAAGQVLELASFYDTTAGPEAALGVAKLTFCLPPDDVPPNTPGRSPLGIKLIDALISFNAGVITNPAAAGQYNWISIWTPYTPGAGTANAAGTVTALGVNGLPVAATLKGTYDKRKKSARLAGRVSAAGQFRAGVKLPLYAGTSPSKLKRSGTTNATSATGAFTAIKRIVKRTYFQVKFAIPAVDVTSLACGALPPTLPKCVSAMVGAFSVATNVAKVAPRK